MDILFGKYCGSYCFSSQQTEWAYDLGYSLLNGTNTTWNALKDFYVTHEGTVWRDIFGALGVAGSYYGLYSPIAADAVITAGGITFSLVSSFIGATIGFGFLLVDVRTNYVPIEYWKYFGFHRTAIWGYELRAYKGSDNCTHFIEIPKNSDGTLNWDEAVYY